MIYIFVCISWLVGVGRAIAESISCLLPEMAVATPKILHSINLWKICVTLQREFLASAAVGMVIFVIWRVSCFFGIPVDVPKSEMSVKNGSLFPCTAEHVSELV